MAAESDPPDPPEDQPEAPTRDSDADDDEDGETLPFDVELEQLPWWVNLASALVVVVGVLVTAHLVTMLALLPFLLASSVGRRFLHKAMHVVVSPSALTLGTKEISRGDIVDVWLDSDEVEPRVTVHYQNGSGGTQSKRIDFEVLYFPNRDQAIRFAEALQSSGKSIAAGYAPHPIDALSSLRFMAVAASFVETGRWLSLPVFLFAALGIFTFVRANQVIARADDFVIRSVFGEKTYAYKDVKGVVVDTGTVSLTSGGEATIARMAIRDGMLASPAWLERTRRRVLKRIREAVQSV